MINKELMKKKLESLKTNGKSDKKESVFFRPDEGDQDVRFLPSADGDPFKEYYFHYNLGEGFLCPRRNFGEKCAVCDYAFELWKEDTDESKKSAKNLFTRQRFFTNVILRGKEELGPKPYGYGKETYEQLIKMSLDPDYDDFTDLELGRDFKLSYTKPEKKGAYPKTKLTIKPKQTPLASSKKIIKEILDKVKPIESFLLRKSPDEVRQTLETYLDDPFDNSTNRESKLGDSVNNLSSDEEAVVTSIDQAIEELAS